MRCGSPVFGIVRDTAPVVRTSSGAVLGENREGVAVFRGIPYGGDVSGENRFLPAEPAAPWEGVRDCTTNGPIAVQFGTSISGSADFGDYFSGGHPEKFGCEKEVQGENCLVLNVLTPGLDEGKRPVVVYIHGGGFATGSGTLVLGADQWVREEDLVVVGVNHRLNVFGYLNLGAYDPAYSASGMAGILDLVLALRWVRDNIASFGGDPEKVTIMGESGGGGKVNHLLALKEATGLFRAAIVESGSGAPSTLSPEAAWLTAKGLLDKLGIPEEDWKKLLEIPAQDLLQATADFSMSFSPSGDEEHLPYNAAGEYWEANPALTLLVGASADEVAAFDDPEPLTWEQLRQRLVGEGEETFPEISPGQDEKGRRNWGAKLSGRKGGLDGTPGITPDNVDQAIAIFRELSPDADPYHILMRIRSQCGPLGAGAYQQEISKAAKGQGAVYGYYVTFQAPHPRHPEQRFAWHTADLPLQMRVVAYKSCEKVSEAMAHAWAAFIRTGSPSTPELSWPPFTLEEKKVLVFGDHPHVESDPTAPYREFNL